MRQFRVLLQDDRKQWVKFGADDMEDDSDPAEAAVELADSSEWESVWGDPEVMSIEVSDDDGQTWIDYAKAGPPPRES